jgi:hypothetical protein
MKKNIFDAASTVITLYQQNVYEATEYETPLLLRFIISCRREGREEKRFLAWARGLRSRGIRPFWHDIFFYRRRINAHGRRTRAAAKEVSLAESEQGAADDEYPP